MGDAVNLAARVMGHAAWGTVVATDDLLERRRTDFELEPVPPFVVKGKSAAIHAHVVGPPRGRHDTATHVTMPLVGRHDEIAEIRDAFAGAHRAKAASWSWSGSPASASRSWWRR